MTKFKFLSLENEVDEHGNPKRLTTKALAKYNEETKVMTLEEEKLKMKNEETYSETLE